MARVLIVGCGCRGQELARELRRRGPRRARHDARPGARRRDRGRRRRALRRRPRPDRHADGRARTRVTIVCWLLGDASPTPDAARRPAADAVREARRHAGARGRLRGRAAGGRGDRARRRGAVADPGRGRRAWAARGRPSTACSAAMAIPLKPVGIQEDTSMADYAKDVLVDTQWVEDHLDDPTIRIVEVDENPALYAEAHIPGAIGFDWKQGPAGPGQARLPRRRRTSAPCSARAASPNDHTIVLYGDRNNWFAAYTYWYLKYYGHDNVKLVNGPREKWIAEGRPTTTDVPAPRRRRRSPPQPGDDAHPRQARRGARRARLRDQARRRPLAAGVLRRADRDARLRAGGRAARRPHPGRGVGPVGAGGARGRHVQVGRRAVASSTARRASPTASRSSPTAGSASARAHTWFVLHELLGKRRRQELRRLVDRVGQPGRRPDREGR